MQHNTPPDGPTLPSWCAPPDRLVGRDALVERVRDALRDGPVTLVGEAGVGATAVAATVVHALVATGAVGRVAAWRAFDGATVGDAALLLGRALHADLPGDLASLEHVLGSEPPVAILLDDADLSASPCRDLVALGDRVVWIATGRAPVIGEPIEVAPLADADLAALLPPGVDARPYQGRPLLTTFPAPPRADDLWAGLAELADDHALLAELPMGLPDDPSTVPAPYRLDLTQRVVLRRAVREALGAGATPSPPALAAALRDRLEPLHRLACDVETGHAPEDLPLLRIAARRIADPELRALAAAGAARLALRAFQAPEALNIARNALLRPLPAGARGLLRWLEGDALWAQGADSEARSAWHAGAADLRDGALDVVCAALSRRCAEREAARGHAPEARAWLRMARDALVHATEPVALADCQRIAAEMAAHAGELVGAESLYDEAESLLAQRSPPDAAEVGVWLGRAALAIVRGQLGAATSLLDRASARATDPRHTAAIAWRRGELALRRGDRDGAERHEQKARYAWRSVGAVPGLLLCARLRGDIAASAGDREAALAHWDEALRLCARHRDLAALERVLTRILAVEGEGAPGPHLDRWREIHDLALVLAGEGRHGG